MRFERRASHISVENSVQIRTSCTTLPGEEENKIKKQAKQLG